MWSTHGTAFQVWFQDRFKAIYNSAAANKGQGCIFPLRSYWSIRSNFNYFWGWGTIHFRATRTLQRAQVRRWTCIFGDGGSKWFQTPPLSSPAVRIVLTIRNQGFAYSAALSISLPDTVLWVSLLLARSVSSVVSASKLSHSHTGIMKAEDW